jgi:flagellar hook-length control protein FliK
MPSDRVTVHLPEEAGGGRIQIAVRGDVVHARIVSPDEATTRQLETGLGELRGALAKQGFQEAHVQVDPRGPADGAWITAAAAESGATGDSRQQETQTPERHERDRHQDGPRSEQRQQHQQGRSQQRARKERER